MKHCQKCGMENQDDIRHCQACGARLFRPAERPCTKCGISNELGTRYCKGCGMMLMPSVVSQRKPNEEHSKRVLGTSSDQIAPATNDPEMPEWITRFVAPKSTPPENEPPKPDESVSQVMSLLRRILGIAPNDISSIQIRKKDGETIDLPADSSEHVEIKRTTNLRWD